MSSFLKGSDHDFQQKKTLFLGIAHFVAQNELVLDSIHASKFEIISDFQIFSTTLMFALFFVCILAAFFLDFFFVLPFLQFFFWFCRSFVFRRKIALMLALSKHQYFKKKNAGKKSAALI